jgi:hypothetical protein
LRLFPALLFEMLASLALLSKVSELRFGRLEASGFLDQDRTGRQSPSALLFEEPLNTFDRITFVIEKVLNRAQKFYVIWPVIASPAAALQRFDLRKTRFPKAQDMLR